MSDSEKDPGPDDPSYYAPRRLRDIGAPADRNWRVPVGQDRPSVPAPQLPTHVPPPDLRLSRDGDGRSRGRSDAFNEALAKVLREQMEAEQGGSGFAQARRSSFRALASFAFAGATAALVALTCFALISPEPGFTGNRILAALGSWQAIRSFSAQPAPRNVSTLVVRNQSGLANELLQLGVGVNQPNPGATVAIRGLPDGTKLSEGARKSAGEWRVRAEDIADAKVMPPIDFVGDMNLSVELRDADGAAQVTSSLQLTWKPPAPVAEALALNTAIVPAAPAPAVAAAPPPPVMAPAQPAQAAAPAQPPMVVASATPMADVPSPSPTPAELTAMQVAADIRRAQELLATGDVKAARVLLMRAAESHDAHAALALAKTFDPAVSRQSSIADKGGPDPAQARNWYQKAREWGSPEAQRMLDALASYRR
ncbi:hypothetical protein [Bradyrhizobium sp.]|uniref:hypothetical protein n=1 Tax=Bradyrhizobium sp. TaxID=376 RepID=UPI002B6014BB|nr:hypothetical protein [Bradyrhizobium sp.]HWX62216.1 hypothetical protein [Bradyrhizobium sp.]